MLEVPDIEIVRTFESSTKIEKTTACLKYDKRSRKYWLYVVARYDPFDVARWVIYVVSVMR